MIRIGIDLDGTITDFYSSLLKHGVEFGEKNFNNGKIKNYNGFTKNDGKFFDFFALYCYNVLTLN